MRTFAFKTVDTHIVTIYTSGPIKVIEHVCRESVFNDGHCVTVKPAKFIYTGGEEFGVEIGLLNYPRYPETAQNLVVRAKELAIDILKATYQRTALVVGTQFTTLISYEEQDK